MSEEEQELKIAFGPVGVAGLALVAAAVLKRSPLLAAASAAALWADVTFPQLRGWKAMRVQAGG